MANDESPGDYLEFGLAQFAEGANLPFVERL